MRKKILTGALLAFGIFQSNGLAQSFDNSGNTLLQGNYYVRQIAFDKLTSTGTIGRARSLTGTINFDGKGGYTFTGQLSDSTSSAGGPKAYNFTGTYSVASSGLLKLQDPVSTTESVYGGVGKSVFVGSSTESTVLNTMIGVPAGSSASNSSLQGQYRVAAMDFPNGDVTKTSNSSFLLNADGQGNVSDLSVTGHAANTGNTETTQTVSKPTYSLNSTGGTFTFPASGTSPLISGTKQFFLSADGNVLIAGSANGYDLEVGIRPFQGTASNANFAGTFFSTGIDYDSSSLADNGYHYLDAFYGSINANGLGTALVHERLTPDDGDTYDYTFDNEFKIAGDGSITQTNDRIFLGAGGQMSVGVGRQTAYSLELDVAAQTLPATGSVYLNPVGVVNAATYAPITNPIAPGEMIRLYGTGLAGSTTVASSLPLPNTLGGVSVSINGRPAPVYLVSATQVICIVPYATTESFAKIQVTNNGVASNAVTTFTETSAPGAFTLSANGIGPGAILHANGSLVSSSSPAKLGETVVVYVTGLGPVTPAVTDGAAASSTTLSKTVDTIDVIVDSNPATVSFAGLAPGFVGLYQINFTIPSGVSTGEAYLDLADEKTGSLASFATIFVSK